MNLKAGQIILFFLTFYLVFGLVNSVLFGVPNNTNDFAFHYYKTIGDFENSVVQEYYSVDFFKEYPSFFHFLAKPFAFNEFGVYAFAIILICLIAPLLIFKLSGVYGVVVYFALSLPHLVIYNATFPSFLIMIYFLIYLFKRKNIQLYLFLLLLSIITHRKGMFFILLIGGIEIICWVFIKYNLKEKLYGMKYNLGAGFLIGNRFDNIFQIFNMFSNHLNFYYVWIVRKKIDLFYGLILLSSIYLSVVYDFRTIMLAQIIICVLVGKLFKFTKPKKFFWLITIFLFLFNFLSFLFETQRFINS
jgi:hypothetical protein